MKIVVVYLLAFLNHNILSTGGVRERKSHRLNGKTKKVNKKPTSAGLLYYIRVFYDLAEHVCLLVCFCTLRSLLNEQLA